jgi:circadian clock protein KaiC
VERVSTGVPGLDEVLAGGLPRGTVTLVGGRPGAGKTVLTQQILHHHVREGGRGLSLTTLSEPSDKLLRNIEGFAWFDPAVVGGGVVYLSLHQAIQEQGVAGAVEMVVREARRQRATFLVIDGFRAVHALAGSEVAVRRFVFDLGGQLGLLGVTTLLAGEYGREDTARFPEFTIADGVVALELGLDGVRETRTLQVAKLRGSGYLDGLHPLRIDDAGARVFPRQTAVARVTPYRIGDERVSTGVAGLDAMLGGGLLRNTMTLVLGTPGTGKTLLGLQFLDEGRCRGEPALLVTCDESPEHLELKAAHFGLGEGRFFGPGVGVIYAPSVELDVDELAARIREAVAARGVRRVVVDGVGNLEAALAPGRLNDYVVSLINYVRGQGITAMHIRDVPQLAGGPLNVGGLTYSATSDNVVLMHHVDLGGRLGYVTSVVNTRDSAFDHVVRHHTIDAGGIRIGEPLLRSEATLTGSVSQGAERGGTGRRKGRERA